MLWSVLIVLLILWALGFGFGVLGNLVHLLLVVALIVLVMQVVTGRRAVYSQMPDARPNSGAQFNVNGICQGLSDALC